MRKTMIGMFVLLLIGLQSSSLTAFDKTEVDEEIMSRLSLYHEVYPEFDGYSVKIVRDIKTDAVLPSLCNAFLTENHFYVDYLVKDLVLSFLKNRDRSITEPDRVIDQYKKYLEQNKEQLIPVISLFASYLQGKGHVIKALEKHPKEKISISVLKAVAVRHILPKKLSDDGSVTYKLCVAGEGFADYKKRNAQLEAFTFETIFNASKDGSLEPVLKKCSQVAARLNLSTETDIALKRAQGVFWGLLFTDTDFEKLLMGQYNTKKSYLLFLLEPF